MLIMGDESLPPTASDEVSVRVIVPNLPVEAAVKRVEPDHNITVNDVRVVGYPKFLFDYQCTLNRMFFSDRDVSISITIDAITGGRLRNDVYPDLETRTFSREALLQPRLVRDDAVEKARSVLRKYFSFHYPTYILMSGMPKTRILQEDLAFGLYWLVPDSVTSQELQNVSIVDSISGDIIANEIQMNELSDSDFH